MVAVGFSGTTITSAFGTQGWTGGFTGTKNDLNAIAYGNGEFVAVGIGSTVLTSPDGALWTPQSLGTTADLNSVAYGPAGFVAIGSTSTANVILTSPDGVAWTPQQVPQSLQLIRIIYANNSFVAVGASGAVVTSSDGGFTWITQNSGTSSTMEGIAYGPSEFIAVGGQGAVAVSGKSNDAHLYNISTRGYLGAGVNQNLVAGFFTDGTGSKRIVVRGIGPNLAVVDPALGGQTVAYPMLTLFNGSAVALATNTAWGGGQALIDEFATVYATPLQPNSSDTAVFLSVPAGLGIGYTAEVDNLNKTPGIALAEVYDYDSYTSTLASHLINISSRAFVGSGDKSLVAGFWIIGSTSQTLLIRAVGPGLASSAPGLSGETLARPTLTLYDSSDNVIASNAGWSNSPVVGTSSVATGIAPATAAIMSAVYATSLAPGSTDCAMVVNLPPGGYTAQVSSADASTGIALVEVYNVP
jgi:hypothetical protein